MSPLGTVAAGDIVSASDPRVTAGGLLPSATAQLTSSTRPTRATSKARCVATATASTEEPCGPSALAQPLGGTGLPRRQRQTSKGWCHVVQAGSGTPPGSPPGSSGVASTGAGGRVSGAPGSNSPGSSGTGSFGLMTGSGSGVGAPMGTVKQSPLRAVDPSARQPPHGYRTNGPISHAIRITRTETADDHSDGAGCQWVAGVLALRSNGSSVPRPARTT